MQRSKLSVSLLFLFFLCLTFFLFVFLSCPPKETHCYICNENVLNKHLRIIDDIKNMYEQEVLRVCRDKKASANYACIEKELKKIHTPDTLFILCLYFDNLRYPTPMDPIYLSEELGVEISEWYHDNYQYVCTLNAHAFEIRELCVKEIEQLAKNGNISAKCMMQYIHKYIKRTEA